MSSNLKFEDFYIIKVKDVVNNASLNKKEGLGNIDCCSKYEMEIKELKNYITLLEDQIKAMRHININ